MKVQDITCILDEIGFDYTVTNRMVVLNSGATITYNDMAGDWEVRSLDREFHKFAFLPSSLRKLLRSLHSHEQRA